MNRILLWLFALSLALFGCAAESSEPAAATGTGGSLARFTIVGDYLYTLDNSRLTTLDISNPAKPTPREVTPVGNDAETIFPLKGHLLLGTRSGMLIYQILEDGRPSFVASYEHIISCDPVVANEQYAYVTLRVSGCREASAGARNSLEVIDIRDLSQPKLVQQYDMEGPYGLGLDGETLFVCEGSNGLKIFSLENPEQPSLMQQFTGIDARDVIPLDGLLLVVGPERLIQLDYNDLEDIKLLSEISIGA